MVCSSYGWFIFEFFFITGVFPLVINSSVPISCNHLFLSRASLSCMERKYLNQYPCMTSRCSVFQFGSFLSVALNLLRRIFAFSPSSILSTLFSCCLSIRIFCYVLFVPIFSSEIVLFLVIRLLVCVCVFSHFWW